MKEATFALFVICALLAEIFGTLGGFGSSMLFVPLANFFMDFQSVLGITAIFHVFSNISKLWLFKDHFNWRAVAVMGIPSVILVIVGAILSAIWNPQLLQLILGIFLCVFSILFYIFSNFKIKYTNGNMIVFGGVAGFVAGLVGTGGAIRGYALAAMDFPKESFISTSAAIDFGVDVSRSLIYWEHGYMHLHDWPYFVALFFVAFVGSFLGKKILKKLNQEQFKKIVMGMVFLSGAMLVYKYFK